VTRRPLPARLEPRADADDELAEEIAQMLVRVEGNYQREGSGPGSRFEGQRLEVAQARRVIREIREHDAAQAGGRK
jgi:hypothetical protein